VRCKLAHRVYAGGITYFYWDARIDLCTIFIKQ
jgi:hypothetical protein